MDKACAALWVAPLSIFISGSHLFDYMRANYAMDPKAFRCAPCLNLRLAVLCHNRFRQRTAFVPVCRTVNHQKYLIFERWSAAPPVSPAGMRSQTFGRATSYW